ncbi:MAG: TrbG/VirB9 family P-type conjugative transfer protein [Neisseriaceae bacterium]|jgi:type IV secretory pathway VirB9-like protein
MKKLIFLVLILINSYLIADGYIKDNKMYLYSNSGNNVITCQIQQLCDISLAKGDVFQSWIMTNGDVWADSANAKTNYFDRNGVQHIVIQATGISPHNPTILVGVNNQYHFNLIAATKSRTNTYVFIDKKESSFNSTNAVIDDGLAINLQKNKNLDCEYYYKGDIDTFIKPVKVCNDGHKTYIQMPSNIDTTDLPTVSSFGINGQLIQLNNPRYRKPYFVVDNVLQRIAIVSGSVDNDNQVRIDIYHGKPPGFWKWLFLQYDRN